MKVEELFKMMNNTGGILKNEYTVSMNKFMVEIKIYV